MRKFITYLSSTIKTFNPEILKKSFLYKINILRFWEDLIVKANIIVNKCTSLTFINVLEFTPKLCICMERGAKVCQIIKIG